MGQVPEALEDVKKTTGPATLNERAGACLKTYASSRDWRQAESRFGVQTLPRRRLTLTTVKPVVKGHGRCKAVELYGVVEALPGEGMIPPYDRVTADNFQQFLNAGSHQ